MTCPAKKVKQAAARVQTASGFTKADVFMMIHLSSEAGVQARLHRATGPAARKKNAREYDFSAWKISEDIKKMQLSPVCNRREAL